MTVEYLKKDNTYATLNASEYVVHMAYPATIGPHRRSPI